MQAVTDITSANKALDYRTAIQVARHGLMQTFNRQSSYFDIVDAFQQVAVGEMSSDRRIQDEAIRALFGCSIQGYSVVQATALGRFVGYSFHLSGQEHMPQIAACLSDRGLRQGERNEWASKLEGLMGALSDFRSSQKGLKRLVELMRKDPNIAREDLEKVEDLVVESDS